jgi:hypothetical protein
VVTTRLSVVAEQWWVDRGFQRFDLLTMSRHSVQQYVHGWHSIVRADQPDTPEGDRVRAELSRGEERLLKTLSNRPALGGMSVNPLLCGLLCALHLERGEHLPENRRQVYEEAVTLLLERWPHIRHRARAMAQGGSAVPGDSVSAAPLGGEELRKLLQRLAFWLVTNRQVVLTAQDARRRVESCMSGLRGGDSDPDSVLRYLAHESGLLRELGTGGLEFVHRTFLEHFAAKEVVEEDNLNLMLERADKPHWHEVVVMAGAHARPSERARILRGLLDYGRSDDRHRHTLYLLAAAVLEQSPVLPEQDSRSADLRTQVKQAVAELIPPRSADAADQLATAGSFVLDLVPGPQDLTDADAALAVRAVARIAAQWNPPGALEKILQFTMNPTHGAITQLLEAWGRVGDYGTYAREVLSEIDFSSVTVDLQNGRRIEHIGHLRTITTLILRNDVPSLGSLAGLTRLRRLTLRDNGMTSLQRLPNTESLRVLVLDRCSAMVRTRPVDLSPLRTRGLNRLVISGLMTKIDLASLAGVRLHSLRLSVRLARSSALPPDLRVRHLSLVTGARVGGLGGLRGVRSIVMDWVPDDDELATLAELPGLRRLVLWRVAPGTAAPALPGVAVTVWSRRAATEQPERLG